MNIFSKYLLKSIAEKKGRTLLIICSIAISTALLLSALGSTDSIEKNYTQKIQGAYGGFNISIAPNEKSEKPLFKESDLSISNIKDSFKASSISGCLTGKDDTNVNMLGTSLQDFKKFKSIKILKGDSLDTFTGNKVIISESTSKSLKVSVGDKVNFSFLGKDDEFVISEIVSNDGMFISDTNDNFTVVTPINNVNSIYGVHEDGYNYMLLSVKNNDLDSWIKNFNSDNKLNNISAKLLVSQSDEDTSSSMIKTLMLFMLVIVLIMTVFIIYSSFKLIITERIPVIGTFLSQGASKLSIINIFLKESLIYGIISGIIGDLLGAGIIAVTSIINNPFKAEGVKASITLNPVYLIVSFVFAVLISLASSILPLLSIRKMPVKEVILNNFEASNKLSIKTFIIGVVFILISIAMHLSGPHIKSPRPYIFAVPSLFIALAGIILILPKLTEVLLYPQVRFFKQHNATSMLSINNVRSSKLLTNNIRLIGVSIIAIMMVMSLKSSLVVLLKGVYDDINYDVEINVSTKNPVNLSKITDIMNGYTDASNIVRRQHVDTHLGDNFSKDINLMCIDPENFKSYDSYMAYDDKDAQLEELDNNDDGVILSKKIATRYHIKVGDTITLTSDDKKANLKVLSTVNAKFMNMGNVNLISYKTGLKYFDIKYPSSYYVSSNNQNETLNDLKEKLKGLGAEISTKQQSSEHDDASITQITGLLGVFSYITMIIGAFGIMSNVSISFIQRKREMSVLSSVGLTTSSRRYMLILENACQALIGLAASFLSAIWINMLLEDIFKYLVLDMNFKYPYDSLAVISIVLLVLMFIISIPSILKSKSLNVVKELKYE